MTTLPPPNLHGDYKDSCVVCLRGTDTGMAFTGEAEFLEAALRVLGLPNDEASKVMDRYWRDEGADPGMVLSGDHTMTVRICAECVAKSRANFPAPTLITVGVPEIRPAT